MVPSGAPNMTYQLSINVYISCCDADVAGVRLLGVAGSQEEHARADYLQVNRFIEKPWRHKRTAKIRKLHTSSDDGKVSTN